MSSFTVILTDTHTAEYRIVNLSTLFLTFYAMCLIWGWFYLLDKQALQMSIILKTASRHFIWYCRNVASILMASHTLSPSLYDSPAMHTFTTKIFLKMSISMIVKIKKLPVMSDCVDCSDEPEDFLYELKQHRKNNHSNLIIGSLNINSLRNKFDTVHYLLKCQYIVILALCETKLDDSFPKCQFDVPG